MSARIEKDFYFQSGLHFEGKFYINAYDIVLSMLVDTNSIHEQNVAMDRILYYLKEIMQNAVLVHMLDVEAINKYKNAGVRVCELPDEPWDQIVAMVLLTKLNAVVEGRLKITDLVMGSSMSEGVRYSIVSEEAENILNGNFWWNNPSLSFTNDTEPMPENVVKLFRDDEWASTGLVWKEKDRKED